MRASPLGQMQAGTECRSLPRSYRSTGRPRCRGTACRPQSSRLSAWVLKHVTELLQQDHLRGTTNRIADGAHFGIGLR